MQHKHKPKQKKLNWRNLKQKNKPKEYITKRSITYNKLFNQPISQPTTKNKITKDKEVYKNFRQIHKRLKHRGIQIIGLYFFLLSTFYILLHSLHHQTTREHPSKRQTQNIAAHYIKRPTYIHSHHHHVKWLFIIKWWWKFQPKFSK